MLSTCVLENNRKKKFALRCWRENVIVSHISTFLQKSVFFEKMLANVEENVTVSPDLIAKRALMAAMAFHNLVVRFVEKS